MELQLVQLTILMAGKVVARNAKTMMVVIIGLGGEILVNASFYRNEVPSKKPLMQSRVQNPVGEMEETC